MLGSQDELVRGVYHRLRGDGLLRPNFPGRKIIDAAEWFDQNGMHLERLPFVDHGREQMRRDLPHLIDLHPAPRRSRLHRDRHQLRKKRLIPREAQAVRRLHRQIKAIPNVGIAIMVARGQGQFTTHARPTGHDRIVMLVVMKMDIPAKGQVGVEVGRGTAVRFVANGVTAPELGARLVSGDGQADFRQFATIHNQIGASRLGRGISRNGLRKPKAYTSESAALFSASSRKGLSAGMS